MNKLISAALLLICSAIAGVAQQPAVPAYNTLKVGDTAPDFTLSDTKGQAVKLSDFHGKNKVVLAFFVLAFTGGWTKEMEAYQADIAKFEAANTKVFGISMDASPSLKAFAASINVTSVPMLSDWNRTVTKEYGLFNEASGYGRRATFVVDKEGKIARIELGGPAIDPTGAYETCNILDRKLVVAPPKP